MVECYELHLRQSLLATADFLIQDLNVMNLPVRWLDHGCRILLLLVLVSAAFRFSNNSDTCKDLRTSGTWLDLSPNGANIISLSRWQPRGCKMHQYSGAEAGFCIGGVTKLLSKPSRKTIRSFGTGDLLFMGDSITRQLFWAFARRLDSAKAAKDEAMAMRHADLSFTPSTRSDITLSFLWRPFAKELSRELLTNHTPFIIEEYGMPTRPKKEMVIIGMPGLWSARYGNSTPVRETKSLLSNISVYLNESIIIPIQKPYYARLSEERSRTLTPAKVDSMQGQLRGASSSLNVMWSFESMTSGFSDAYLPDGIHLVNSILDVQVDVVLNSLCNAKLAKARRAGDLPPIIDHSCCLDHGVMLAWSQILISILYGCMVVLCCLFSSSDRTSNLVRRATAYIVCAVLICVLSDRTSLFVKAEKVYKSTYFTLPCALALTVGIATLRLVDELEERHNGKKVIWRAHSILPRRQTEEWKGWMQIVILVYHYVGASKIVWAYQIARILVGSYVFMTGYGHTLYFLQTRDFSLKRASSVLVRLNLLACLLMYPMGTQWTFYYFPPMVSVYFLIVFTCMQLFDACQG